MTIDRRPVLIKINNIDHDYSYWQILSLVCPLKSPRDIAFIPQILNEYHKHHQDMTFYFEIKIAITL